MAWGGTSISECRVPPRYLSLLYQSTPSALVINKDLSQKKRSTASQLPDTPASLISAISSVPSPETGGSGSGCGGTFVDMSSTQHSNVCHRIAMADTQVLEHSGGSGLDHENRLLCRVPRMCELCLPTVIVECYRRESRPVAVESF